MGTTSAPEVTPRPPLLHRLTPRQLVAVDLALVAVLLVLAGAHATGGDLRLPLVWALAAAAVATRRSQPVVSLLLVTASIGVARGLPPVALPDVLVAFPVYQLAATRPRRTSLGMLAIELAVLTGFALSVVAATRGGPAGAIVVAVAAWFVGDSVRVRRVYVAGLADQAAQRQREVLERAQRSVAEKRLEIARELHDVVAHSLSVIAVQSGVGRHVIDTNPKEAKSALAAVESTSRAALDELRRMLGVLRRDEGRPASLDPAPGVATLARLADRVRGAGVPVSLVVDDVAVGALSPSAELSVYRIVQEALTNVVKHAGPATARVSLRAESGSLVVEIADTGRGCRSPDRDTSSHHGIVGMGERVGLFGGTLEARNGEEGGFCVVARLPLDRVATA